MYFYTPSEKPSWDPASCPSAQLLAALLAVVRPPGPRAFSGVSLGSVQGAPNPAVPAPPPRGALRPPLEGAAISCSKSGKRDKPFYVMQNDGQTDLQQD